MCPRHSKVQKKKTGRERAKKAVGEKTDRLIIYGSGRKHNCASRYQSRKRKKHGTYAEEMLRDFFPTKSDGMIKMSERGRCASFKLIS